mgnify:FL=1
MLNSVVLVGRAGKDAEIKYLEPSGKAKAHFNLAVDRPGKDKPPLWIRIELWDKTAQVAADFVKKGSLVAITGRLDIQQWEDRESGQKREMALIVAQNLRLLEKRSEGEGKRNADPDEEDVP